MVGTGHDEKEQAQKVSEPAIHITLLPECRTGAFGKDSTRPSVMGPGPSVTAQMEQGEEQQDSEPMSVCSLLVPVLWPCKRMEQQHLGTSEKSNKWSCALKQKPCIV